MTLAELKRFDVGRIDPSSKYARQFPVQKPVDGQRFPTLAELFDLVGSSGKVVRFNIETKLSPDNPVQSPDPDTFARLVVESIRSRRARQPSHHPVVRLALAAGGQEARARDRDRLPDRSVDPARQERRSRARPSPWLAGLDPADHGGSIPRLVKAAGCGSWSPRFSELTPALVEEAHGLALKVVPWTVNARDDMARIIDMKADGLITDYPDRAREVMAEKGMPLP